MNNSMLKIVLLLMSSTVLFSASQDTITWMIRNFPPSIITEGKFAGQGSTQKETEMVKKSLPEYLHLNLETNIDRMTLMMKNGEKICRGALIKTPDREKYMYFSMPHNFYPVVRIYFKRDNYLKFKEYIKNDRISLNNLLAEKKIKMAVESGRSYGTALDPILKKYSEQANILSRKFSDTEGTISMLIAGRFDYLIEFPFSVGYFLKQQNIKSNIVQGVQIAEMPDDYLLGYFATPKNEWGQKLIDIINLSLVKLRQTPEYRSTMEEWLEDDILPDYRKKYNSIFLNSK